jgi:hypothetical protein
MRILETVRDADVPDAWVGAGVLRDLVWNSPPRDVDVAFFDTSDLSRANDLRVTGLLHRRRPDVPWEAKNQAAVHTWYAEKFGGVEVEPLTSIHDAVSTWPETATAVAVRLKGDGSIEVCAPFGLADLFGRVWRRNPRRISVEQSRVRLARLRATDITVIPP